MPKRSSKPKKKAPTDVNALASFILASATAEPEEREPDDDAEPDTRNQAAVALGRLGGLKGGHARAASLSKKKRAEIARLAASARWKKKG